ncbi:MAG: hypothetical protein AAFV53_24655 [Myxococcota bacterium]
MRTLLLCSVIAMMACDTPTEDLNSSEQGELRVHTVHNVQSDLVGFQLDFQPVRCSANQAVDPNQESFALNINLVDGVFPEAIRYLDDDVDPQTRAMTTRMAIDLTGGCYDLLAVPVSNFNDQMTDFETSKDCASVELGAVNVQPARAVQAVLRTRCDNN